MGLAGSSRGQGGGNAEGQDKEGAGPSKLKEAQLLRLSLVLTCMATWSSKCCECVYQSPRTLQALSKDLRIKPARMEGEDSVSMDLPVSLSRKAMKYSL